MKKHEINKMVYSFSHDDQAFNQGYISFGNDGQIILSGISKAKIFFNHFILPTIGLRRVDKRYPDYPEYHRAHILLN